MMRGGAVAVALGLAIPAGVLAGQDGPEAVRQARALLERRQFDSASLVLRRADATSRLSVTVPRDTVLAPDQHWPLHVATPAEARVTVTLAPLLPEEPPLFTETRRARGPQTFLPLPAAAAVPAAPMIGAYRVVVTAEDSGGPADTLVRVLLVQRLAADTQLHPPEIDRDVLLAESLTTARRRPAFLLLTAMGVGAIVASKGWSGEQASPTTVVIPGALALGGIVWFFKGKVETQAVPANVAHNQRLRNERATAVRQVAAANERARTAMPFRVRIVDQR